MALADALLALGGSFLGAAVLARVGARIGMPTIPLFIVAGMLLGPHTFKYSLFNGPEDLHFLAPLGLIFLLFYLGLEFDIEHLVGGGRRLIAATAVHIGLNVGAGLIYGAVLGWGVGEMLVLAGVMGVSSSAIITKLLVELGRLGRPETPLILGLIVGEDIFFAFYLALLEPVLGHASSLSRGLFEFLIACGFLLVLAAITRWGGRIVSEIVHTDDDELLTLSFIGLVVLTAGAAETLGVTDAIGALMVGLILGSAAPGPRIRNLVRPLRNAFAAIFFFSVGLTIDPSELSRVAVPVLIAVAITVVVNIPAGVFAVRTHGLGRRSSAAFTTAVLARGEFALVIAALVAGSGLDKRLLPFIDGYVLVLAILGPLAATRSRQLSRLLPRRLFAGASGRT